MHLRTALPAAALAAASVVALAAGPATAAPTTPSRPATSAPLVDPSGARDTCVADIDLRVAKLGALSAGLNGATAVTAAHRTAQQAALSAASSGLAALRTKVAGDTDLRTLKDDCAKVVQDYRVFALRAPQTADVVVGDTQAAAVARLSATVPTLTDALAKLAAAGKDVTAARTALADLQAKLADAGPKAQGLADSVLPVTPAQFDADKAILTPAHTTALQVRTDLAGARADLKAIGAALEALAR